MDNHDLKETGIHKAEGVLELFWTTDMKHKEQRLFLAALSYTPEIPTHEQKLMSQAVGVLTQVQEKAVTQHHTTKLISICLPVESVQYVLICLKFFVGDILDVSLIFGREEHMNTFHAHPCTSSWPNLIPPGRSNIKAYEQNHALCNSMCGRKMGVRAGIGNAICSGAGWRYVHKKW